MKNYPVHIIIPVYNSAEFLEKCIESCLFQTYKNIDIFLIDDGSTDDSISILSKYESNPKIHIIKQENKGPGAARNAGILACNNNGYITFVDSDDWISPDYIEHFFNAEQVDFDLSFYSNKDFTCSKENILYSLLTWDSPRGPVRKLIKTDIVKRNLFDEKYYYGEDLLFNFGVFLNSNSFVMLNINECGYNISPNNRSLTRSKVTQKRLRDSYLTWYQSFLLCEKFEFLNSKILKAKFINVLANEFLEFYGSNKIKDNEYKTIKKYVNKNKIIKKFKPENKIQKRKKILYLYFRPLYKTIRKIVKA